MSKKVKIPSKKALKPKRGKQSNTPTLKAAMMKLAGEETSEGE